MKRKKQKKIWLLVVAILAIVLVIGGGVILYTHLHSINHNEIAYIDSMVEKQQQLEADFDLENFTIDEAQVILNPYGNSPLTALVAFDTKEEVEVKVNPTDANNVIGHKKENVNKLKEIYDVDLVLKQDESIKQGKSKIEVTKTFKDFAYEEKEEEKKELSKSRK